MDLDTMDCFIQSHDDKNFPLSNSIFEFFTYGKLAQNA